MRKFFILVAMMLLFSLLVACSDKDENSSKYLDELEKELMNLSSDLIDYGTFYLTEVEYGTDWFDDSRKLSQNIKNTVQKIKDIDTDNTHQDVKDFHKKLIKSLETLDKAMELSDKSVDLLEAENYDEADSLVIESVDYLEKFEDEFDNLTEDVQKLIQKYKK